MVFVASQLNERQHSEVKSIGHKEINILYRPIIQFREPVLLPSLDSKYCVTNSLHGR
jgi:hypothetical protein